MAAGHTLRARTGTGACRYALRVMPASPPLSSPRGGVPGVARSSFANLVGGGLSAVSTFVMTVVLARTMTQDDVGTFFTVTSLFLLLTTVGQLGTGTGLVYFIARGEHASRATAGPFYLRTAAIPVLAVAVVGAVGLVVVASPLSGLLGLAVEDRAATAIVVAAVFVPLAAVLNLCTTASRGLGSMRSTVVLDQVARPALQLVLVSAATLGDRVDLVVLAYVLPYLPTALGAWRWWRSDLPASTSRSTPPEAPASRREFWRFTAPRALAGGAQLAMQRMDIVLVGALTGAAEAAVYTAATRFLVVGQLIGVSLSRAVQPRLARAIGAEDRDQANHLYRVATCWLVLLAWPFYWGMSFLAVPFLSIFGRGYRDGDLVVVVLALTMLVATGCGMVDSVLLMAGKSSWNLANVLVAFAVTLALDLLLIPVWGMEGAAVAWAAGILIANLLPLGQLAWSLRMHPFGRGTVLAMLLSTACFAALPGITVAVAPGRMVPLILALASGSLLWLLGCRVLRDQLQLTGLLSAVRPRRG